MSTEPKSESNESRPRVFIIEQIIRRQQDGTVLAIASTRAFPNRTDILHIGHASDYLSYSMAEEFGGKFNLRFDDINPTKEKLNTSNRL